MTRMSIPRDALHAEVKLAAFGIHSIMLGLFLALVFAVVHYSRREHLSPKSTGASSPTPRNEWSREDRLLFAGSMVLTVTTSANWICSCMRLLKAYNASGNSPPSHVEMDNTISAAQMVFRVLTWCVADVIVISRVYVVWNGKLGVVLLPAISLAVLLASGLAIAYDTAVLDADSSDNTFANWKLVNSWSTIFTNVYCTGMITYRILRVSRSHAQTGKSPLSAALAALVESAVFYTTIVIITYATAEAEHVSNAFFIEISAPSAALAAVVIHVRTIWRRERVGGEMMRGMTMRGVTTRGEKARASSKPAGLVLPVSMRHTPLGTTGNANRNPLGQGLSEPRPSSTPLPYGWDTRDSLRVDWDVEAQRRHDEASHEAQRVGNEASLEAQRRDKKVSLEARGSEKGLETGSASDGDSSSTLALRPMPSAVVVR